VQKVGAESKEMTIHLNLRLPNRMWEVIRDDSRGRTRLDPIGAFEVDPNSIQELEF
jgi:hypothetical protein